MFVLPPDVFVSVCRSELAIEAGGAAAEGPLSFAAGAEAVKRLAATRLSATRLAADRGAGEVEASRDADVPAAEAAAAVEEETDGEEDNPLDAPGSLGAVIGPSGTGKSSFARFRFGAPAVPAWDEEAPVLAHFLDLPLANRALEAAALPESCALAPHGQLSRGEKSRADLARVLAYLAVSCEVKRCNKGHPMRRLDAYCSGSCDRCSQSIRPDSELWECKECPGPWWLCGPCGRGRCPEVVVVEEFTSLLDRQTAQRVAGGITRCRQDRRKAQTPRGTVCRGSIPLLRMTFTFAELFRLGVGFSVLWARFLAALPKERPALVLLSCHEDQGCSDD